MEPKIRSLTAELREAKRIAKACHDELAMRLSDAQKAGASVAQLVEWTGYSRRMIFYMLKENER